MESSMTTASTTPEPPAFESFADAAAWLEQRASLERQLGEVDRLEAKLRDGWRPDPVSSEAQPDPWKAGTSRMPTHPLWLGADNGASGSLMGNVMPQPEEVRRTLIAKLWLVNRALDTARRIYQERFGETPD